MFSLEGESFLRFQFFIIIFTVLGILSSCQKALQHRDLSLENFSIDYQSLAEHYRSRILYENRFFKPQSVCIQAKLGTNYLFTGLPPFIQQGEDILFAYQKLVYSLKKACLKDKKETQNEDLDFDLVVISLMNPEQELAWISKIKKFFEMNPDKGLFISYPIYGSFLPLDSFSSSILKKVKETYQVDQLNSRIKRVRDLMQRKNSRPCFIYVHDGGDSDRLYEFIGAYQITYLNQNLSEIIETKSSGRSPFSKYALHWYEYTRSQQDKKEK